MTFLLIEKYVNRSVNSETLGRLLVKIWTMRQCMSLIKRFHHRVTIVWDLEYKHIYLAINHKLYICIKTKLG